MPSLSLPMKDARPDITRSDRINDRSVAPVISPVAEASSGARKPEEEGYQKHNQTPKPNIPDHGIPSGCSPRPLLSHLRLVGSLLRVRRVSQWRAAVGAELRIIRIGQTTIWTIHIQAYCNELPTPLAFSRRISVALQGRPHSARNLAQPCSGWCKGDFAPTID
jgi:hypothetical protein